MGNKELVALLKEEGIKDKKVLKAILKINRGLFVPAGYKKEAYGNYPLPVGKGQTISQPWTVAFMLEALELKEGDKVLEIGAGSGWNAALMGFIVGEKGKVISTEVHEELVKNARESIKKAGLKNVKVIKWDGSKGYEKGKPYSKIICTAACPEIPKPWVKQLKGGGIIVAPVGEYTQVMVKAKKVKGKIIKEELGEFQFVPLRGRWGFK